MPIREVGEKYQDQARQNVRLDPSYMVRTRANFLVFQKFSSLCSTIFFYGYTTNYCFTKFYPWNVGFLCSKKQNMQQVLYVSFPQIFKLMNYGISDSACFWWSLANHFSKLGITECKTAFSSGASDGLQVFLSLSWHRRRHKH